MIYKIKPDDVRISYNTWYMVLSAVIDGKYTERMYNGYSRQNAIKMFINENAKYTEPIATKCICNWGGIMIMDIINGKQVISCEHYGDDYLRWSRSQIRYNAKGEPYFIRQGRREYLNEYMKVR